MTATEVYFLMGIMHDLYLNWCYFVTVLICLLMYVLFLLILYALYLLIVI